MKRFSLTSVLIILVLAVILTVTVVAIGPYPSTDDIWVDGAAAVSTTNPLLVAASDIGAGCNTHLGTIYLQWSGIPTSAAYGSSTVTLTTSTVSSIPQPGTLALYGVTDDAMPPAGIGSLLTTIAVPAGAIAAGTNMVFPTSPALVSYLETARTGDGIATFAVRWSACSSHFQNFTDNSTVTPPLLSLYDTNAVTLATFHASGQETLNWPLAAVAATGLLVVGFVAIARRRQHSA